MNHGLFLLAITPPCLYWPWREASLMHSKCKWFRFVTDSSSRYQPEFECFWYKKLFGNPSTVAKQKKKHWGNTKRNFTLKKDYNFKTYPQSDLSDFKEDTGSLFTQNEACRWSPLSFKSFRKSQYELGGGKHSSNTHGHLKLLGNCQPKLALQSFCEASKHKGLKWSKLQNTEYILSFFFF